jgi:hypothetical protein
MSELIDAKPNAIEIILLAVGLWQGAKPAVNLVDDLLKSVKLTTSIAGKEARQALVLNLKYAPATTQSP